uniref:Uncharacterized protein n=1 Tax=Acrobeloides nanus TaxID=290746 RepID=A0A914DF37_9BILA
CSVACGSGIRQREVECVYRDQIVDASLCPESQKPKIQESCTLLACAFWDLLPWSSCSASCGSGVQRRMVQCVRGSNKLIVGERECKEEKPKTERTCERDPCPNAKLEIYWATGPWTECSQSCGNGTQRRIVVCHDHIRELGAEYCTQIEKPPNTRECNIRPCAQWSVGAWQPCPATCGIHHVQRRRVSCVPIGKKKEIEINSVLDELPEIDCDPAAQPEAVRNCGLKACPVEQKPVYGNWTTSGWTENMP